MASKKKLKRKIQDLEKHIEQLTGQKPLSEDERNEIFEKYAFDYSDESDPIKRYEEVSRQRFVYDKLYEKGLDNTAIEKLLDMTLDDIERLHTMKSGIENKSGFILALWGILTATLFDSDNKLLETIKETIITCQYTSFNFWFTSIFAGVLIVTGIISLKFIYKALKPRSYTKFVFEQKEDNFRGAAMDKNVAYMTFLDNVTNSWNENRETINDMADNYHKSLIWVIAFAAVLVLSFIVLV